MASQWWTNVNKAWLRQSPTWRKKIEWTYFTTVWKNGWIYAVIVTIQEFMWSMHLQSMWNMTIESGTPCGDRDAIWFAYLPLGCAPSKHGCSVMPSQRSAGSPIGEEGNCQTTHGSIVLEWKAMTRSAFSFKLPSQTLLIPGNKLTITAHRNVK